MSLLDGGMQEWIREGRPVTSVVPRPHVGNLSGLKTKRVVADAEFVRAHLGKAAVSIVDARLPAFYDGSQTGRGRTEATLLVAGPIAAGAVLRPLEIKLGRLLAARAR